MTLIFALLAVGLIFYIGGWPLPAAFCLGVAVGLLLPGASIRING